MTEDTVIQQLRRKAYLGFHQDGIIDLLIGVSILGFGLWNWFDQPIFAFLALLASSSYIQLKNVITVPRFGYVRFKEGRRETGLAICIGIGLILLAIAVGILALLGPERVGLDPITFLRKFHVYVMSSIGAVIMALFGMWSGIHRLVAYALLMLAAVWSAYGVELEGSIPLLVMGSLLMLIGLVLMVRFILAHRTKAGQVDHGA